MEEYYMKKENEEIVVEICKKYCKTENFILLLLKICKDNNIKNIKEVIEQNLNKCVK